MFDSSLEKTIIGTAVALWFAHGWYLNEKLRSVHEKLDRILESFNGLREYLYEIDPQFDDERASLDAFENRESAFSGLDDIKLKAEKRQSGKRTLNTAFVNDPSSGD